MVYVRPGSIIVDDIEYENSKITKVVYREGGNGTLPSYVFEYEGKEVIVSFDPVKEPHVNTAFNKIRAMDNSVNVEPATHEERMEVMMKQQIEIQKESRDSLKFIKIVIIVLLCLGALSILISGISSAYLASKYGSVIENVQDDIDDGYLDDEYIEDELR